MCLERLLGIQREEQSALMHRKRALEGHDSSAALDDVDGADVSNTGEVGTEKEGEEVRSAESLHDIERQMTDLNAQIETTNLWKRKLEKGKRDYKESTRSLCMCNYKCLL